MLPVIIGGMIGAAITAIVMSEDKQCEESKEVQFSEDSDNQSYSLETAENFRNQIDVSLEKLKSLT